MRHSFKSWILLVGLLVLGVDLRAQAAFQRVASSGKLVIAHRASSVPFSYLNADKKPVGYAIDLCMKIAEAVRTKTGVKNMQLAFVEVTSSNRLSVIEQGKADLECGSTTNNAERREKVVFTIPHFITGARLLVRADSKIAFIEDMKGMKLVSTKGSTPLKMVTQANLDRGLGLTVLEAPEHNKAVDMVESGEAAAFLMDDVLLFGLMSSRANPGAFKVVGRFVTTEPLAIMLAKNDPEFKKLVDGVVLDLIHTREIYALYDKWFMKPIAPKQMALNMPVSYLLRDFWKYPSDFVPF